MRILVIDRSAPISRYQGNELIGYHLFRRLRYHDLTLLCPAPREQLDQTRAALAETFNQVHLVPRRERVPNLAGLAEPAFGWTRARFGWRFDADAARRMQIRLDQLLASKPFDVVHVRQLPMAAFAGRIHHPKLLELIDSSTLQAARAADGHATGGAGIATIQPPESPEARVRNRLRYWLTAWCERLAVRQFPACTTVAAADAAAVRRLAPGAAVHVIPNGVDTEYFAPWWAEAGDPNVVFVGVMSYPPNVDAVLSFYRTVWPQIRQAVPSARFTVVGRDPAPAIQELAADPSVAVTGYVDDVRPWLAGAAVVVCPMVNGSGIKNKVLEAMAAGRPIVATPLGVEALPVADGREVRIASAPPAIAAAVVDLLRDATARRALGRRARDYVVAHHSWEAVARAYDAIYADLLSTAIKRKENGAALPANGGARAGNRS